MTVENDYLPTKSTGSGTQEVFTFSWPILEASHLKVIHTDNADADTTLTLNIDYSISGVGSSTGGSITFPISGSSFSTLSTDETITIMRLTPLEQDTNLSDQGAWSAETVEAAMDKIVIQNQELQEQLNRATLTDPVDKY
jgi:hypothetical protein